MKWKKEIVTINKKSIACILFVSSASIGGGRICPGRRGGAERKASGQAGGGVAALGRRGGRGASIITGVARARRTRLNSRTAVGRADRRNDRSRTRHSHVSFEISRNCKEKSERDQVTYECCDTCYHIGDSIFLTIFR